MVRYKGVKPISRKSVSWSVINVRMILPSLEMGVCKQEIKTFLGLMDVPEY